MGAVAIWAGSLTAAAVIIASAFGVVFREHRTSVKCPRCGTLSRVRDQVCGNCGAAGAISADPDERAHECRRCQREVAISCGRCGTDLGRMFWR